MMRLAAPWLRWAAAPKRANCPRWFAVAALLLGCKAATETENGAAGAPVAQHALPSSAPSPWVTVVEPSDPTLIELPAEVVGDATAHTQVAMVYPSKILAVHVRLGDKVATGDVLVDALVPELARAAATIAAVGEQIDLQEQRLAHLKPLRGEGLIGGRELFELQARLAELRSERKLAAAVLAGAGVRERTALADQGRVKLRAPAPGVVTAIEVVVGEIHDPSAGPMVSLTAESPARVEVQAMRALPIGAELEFETSDGRHVPLADVPLATVANPADGSLRMWFEPVTPVSLPAHLRGRVRVQALAQGALQVPDRAIAWSDGKMVVYKQAAAGATPVEVEVVSRSGSSALVRGEIRVGDTIAANGTAWVDLPDGDH